MAAPNAVLASAAVLTASSVNSPQAHRQRWEKEAWDFYDELGELRFGVTWFANVLSRARLMAAIAPATQGDEPTPIENGPALDAVERLAGGVGGQTQLLRSFGVHLTVPGIGYLIGHPDPEADPMDPAAGESEMWRVYSTDEVKLAGGKWQIQTDRGVFWDLPEESLPVKVWRPHERRHWLPDSPVRAVLATCRELKRINDHVMSSLVSRLAGAGMLILPEEITFPQKPENQGKEDPFLAELMDVMLAPIKDPGNASAVVPFYIKVKSEYVDKVKHLKFDSPLDEKVLALRENCITRLATGLDMPAEVLTGMGGMNHWGAWQVEEAGIKLHVIPTLELICHALTIGYLQPAMRAIGGDPNAIMWFDVSELTVRPDRSQGAIELTDRGFVSPRVAVREAGLEETDLPDDAERREMVGWKLLDQPTMAPTALTLLGIDVPVQPGPPRVTETVPETEPTPTPAPTDQGPPPTQPTAPAPAESGGPSAALLVANEHVMRALEKAGNRVRTLRRGKLSEEQDCPPLSIHECLGGVGSCGLDPATLLEGAWTRVPDVAAMLGEDPQWMAESLDLYCTGLLVSGEAHTVPRLAAFLDARREGASA